MLQKANGTGLQGDMKFSSNLDKSLATFHTENSFPSTGKNHSSQKS